MERFVDTLLSLSREVYAFMMRNTPMKPLADKQNRGMRRLRLVTYAMTLSLQQGKQRRK